MFFLGKIQFENISLTGQANGKLQRKKPTQARTTRTERRLA